MACPAADAAQRDSTVTIIIIGGGGGGGTKQKYSADVASNIIGTMMLHRQNTRKLKV